MAEADFSARLLVADPNPFPDAAWRVASYRAAVPICLGPYELLFELASGGMATVHVGLQKGAGGFERLVAVKRVHAHLLANRDFVSMFRDEAKLSSTIRHANVVSATDVVESAESGELFLVMDYVDAVPLAKLVNERIPAPIAARIVSDLLAGLHAAHEAVDLRGQRLDIVHRDVSPQNVLVGADGVSRLIDFGIAKAAARLADTSGEVLRGKLRYMSPEQVSKRAVDRQTDVFAAGVVLHELLAGKKLFTGEDDADIVLGVLFGAIPKVNSALDAVLAKALERERDRRYATAAEMQAALESACLPASHREVAEYVETNAGALLAARRERVRTALEVTRTAPDDEKKPPRWLWLAAAAMALAGIAWWRWPHPPPPPPAPPVSITSGVEEVPVEAPTPTTLEPVTITGAAPAPKPRTRAHAPVAGELHRNPYAH
jgi:serine/threonine-protein kinase